MVVGRAGRAQGLQCQHLEQRLGATQGRGGDAVRDHPIRQAQGAIADDFRGKQREVRRYAATEVDRIRRIQHRLGCKAVALQGTGRARLSGCIQARQELVDEAGRHRGLAVRRIGGEGRLQGGTATGEHAHLDRRAKGRRVQQQRGDAAPRHGQAAGVELEQGIGLGIADGLVGHRQQVGARDGTQGVTQEVHLEAACGADGSLGIGQPHRQTQAQQIRHALFQVVARHRQVAQVQVGGRVVGGSHRVHAAGQGEAALTVQRMIDHHHGHVLARLSAGANLAQCQRVGVLLHRGDAVLIDDHVGDVRQRRGGEDPHRHGLHLFQRRQRVEAAHVHLGIQRLAAGGESHSDQLARLRQQLGLTARIGDELAQQGRIHTGAHQAADHLGILRFQGIGDGIEARDGTMPGLGPGLIPGAGGGRGGEEVRQLDGAAVDRGHLGQAVERGAGTKGGGQRILLLLRQERLCIQLGQEGVATAHRQGVGTRQAAVAQGILLPQGGSVQGRALQHGGGRPFHRHQHVGAGLGTEPVGEDHVVAGDAGSRLEQPFLQRDQAADGLLLGIAAGSALVVAVVAARPQGVAAAVLERIGRHYHVIGRGIERLERHQVQLARRLGDHEVYPVGQHLLHATRAQGGAVEFQLQQVERGHGSTEFAGGRRLDGDARGSHGHYLDRLGCGPAIQGGEGGDWIGEIGRFGRELQGAVTGTGGQGAGARRIGAAQQIIEIA